MAQRNDRTDMGGVQESFFTTHWSLLEGAGRPQDKDQAMIGLLLERYWRPVYCYLRRKGYSNEEAKDLTQGFFHEVVLSRRLLERADRTRGRFRSFLLHALNQFLIDQSRKESAAKRIPRDKLVPLDISNPPELPQTLSRQSPEDCFNYAWKSEILNRTLSEVQSECESQGLQTHWLLFRDKVLLPTRENRQSQPMKDICIRHGISSESTAFNMLQTVKRHFKAALIRNLRSTVLDEADIDGEWRDILNHAGEKVQKAE